MKKKDNKANEENSKETITDSATIPPPTPRKKPPSVREQIDPSICRRLFFHPNERPHFVIVIKKIRVSKGNVDSSVPSQEKRTPKMSQAGKQKKEECHSSCPPAPRKRVRPFTRYIDPSICRQLFP